MKSATMAETMIRENKQNKSEIMMMVVGSSCHGTDKRTCPDKFRHVCAMYWSAHVILCRNRSLKWKAVLYIMYSNSFNLKWVKWAVKKKKWLFTRWMFWIFVLGGFDDLNNHKTRFRLGCMQIMSEVNFIFSAFYNRLS
jgi:hypothetical protein